MFDLDTRLDVDADTDFEAIAALHAATLPASTLGRLGVSTLMRYYRWVAASPLECLFITRQDGEIAAAAVVSVEPATTLRRFVMHAPFAFGAAAAFSWLGDRMFRREAAAYARDAIAGADAAGAGPELLQIFVGDRHQHRSLGSALLARVERFLEQRGARAYHTRTLIADNERTLAFYRARGFARKRDVTFCGELYALLGKSLTMGKPD